MIKITFPDNQVKEYNSGISCRSILSGLSGKLQKEALAVKINGEVKDITYNLNEDASISFITSGDQAGLELLRHSSAHIMAAAVKRIFKDVKIAIGPSIEDGFYYDFRLPDSFSLEDFQKIEKEMKKISEENPPFERMEVTKKEAEKIFTAQGELFKVELLTEIPDETVSLYKLAEFVDLCRGPHLPSAGFVKNFKLLNLAGAYWRGDEKREMLKRIYGTSFFKPKDLEDYIKLLEEAKKRDHRKVGKELDLFSINEELGTGLVLWHPKGARIRTLIENFWREEHIKNGYELLFTPHIARRTLWDTSGHTNFYSSNMYSPMDIDEVKYQIKPMNCPFHILIYKNSLRSYREFPMRWAELGTVYRYERSGVLHGLLRVRGFTQDDAHIFCREDQLDFEVENTFNFTIFMLKSFGFEQFNIYLSTKPEKYVGSDENWEKATEALRKALDKSGLKWETDPGEGVFYGPKIDIKIKDVLNRAWQCSTIQVDFNLPERFKINYIGSDGREHIPVMIHRALLGSLERFFGCLIEHYGGAFPLWLAPVQIIVLNVTERTLDYSDSIYKMLHSKGFRVEKDIRNEKLGFKVREAQLSKIPYMIILGDKELQENTVSVRTRTNKTKQDLKLDDFIASLQEEILTRKKEEQL